MRLILNEENMMLLQNKYKYITYSQSMKKTIPLSSQVWKKNDQKAQKNGSHSNIYWVRVRLY